MTFDFGSLSSMMTGRYSELVALAAFTAAGVETAIPYGNQARWDFLCREEEAWRSVQVKTVKQCPSGCFGFSFEKKRGANGARALYMPRDVDYLVAVHPASGAIWKIPFEVIPRSRRIALGRKYDPFVIVKGTMAFEDIPTPIMRPYRRRRIDRADIEATRKLFAGASRPATVSDAAWRRAVAFSRGLTIYRIAKNEGVSAGSIHESLSSVKRRILAESAPSPVA